MKNELNDEKKNKRSLCNKVNNYLNEEGYYMDYSVIDGGYTTRGEEIVRFVGPILGLAFTGGLLYGTYYVSTKLCEWIFQ